MTNQGETAGVATLIVRVPRPIASVRVEYADRKIRRILLGNTQDRAQTGAPRGRRDAAFERMLRDDLRRYFRGERVRFRCGPDVLDGTLFREAVWRALATIPYGETRSYAWVAQAIGRPRAARAVGQACGANPLPIIRPCHRVVAADGSLGGFTGGVHLKRALLTIERGVVRRAHRARRTARRRTRLGRV